MDTIKIANFLSRLRKEHNLTQNDLAMQLGVSYQAVSKWERGENLPDSGLLMSLANFYQISVDEILNGEMNYVYDTSTPKTKKDHGGIYISLGISFFILSPVPYLLLESYSEVIATAAILLCIVLGISTFVIYGMKSSVKEKPVTSSKAERKKEFIWGLCTFIFLFVGFVFNVWHPTWLIFVLAGTLTNYFIK